MSATPASPGPNVVVMGVAGCGKSSLARELAARLGRALVEGDDFHSDASRAKMAQGVALTDADRQPWLAALAERLDAARRAGEPVVLTCSALKQRYRERLRAGDPALRFCYLRITPEDALARVSQRGSTHFFSPALVQSQFAALESPEGEDGVQVLDARWPLDQACAAAARGLLA